MLSIAGNTVAKPGVQTLLEAKKTMPQRINPLLQRLLLRLKSQKVLW